MDNTRRKERKKERKILNEIKKRERETWPENVGHRPSCGQVSLLFVQPPLAYPAP